MRKWIPIVIILICTWVSSVSSQTVYYDFDTFKDAAANAKPGDEIILAEGRYDAGSLKMDGINGTEENPIIIRAENIGMDTLDNGTYIDLRHSSYITFQGFVINITEKSTTFKVQTCHHIRITQNVLDGSGEAYYKEDGTSRNSSVWINIQSLWDDPVGLSHHNRIDHNTFKNKHTLGNMIRIDGTDEKYVSQYDVIEYNYFKNMGPRAENEMEAIRIGWSAMSESDGFTRVSNNLFEACNGDPEIISVKCNKNTISHNTFRGCQGTLSLRHGNESLVEGNFFLGEGAEGTGGVRLYGSDHRIINNHFEGLTGTKWDAPITLTYGDAEEGSGSLSNHFRIERAVIANNTLINNLHGVEVGYDNQGKYSKPPRDVIMAYNIIRGDTNALVTYINSPDNMTWLNNLMYPTDDAVVGSGVSFTEDEALIADPELLMHPDLQYFKASEATPAYTPSSMEVGEVEGDIDGQARTNPTNYGADEFSALPVVYKPLSPADVGPSTGEYLYVSHSEITFPKSGGTQTVSVSSNLSWSVSKDSAWITLDPESGSGDGSFLLTVPENTTGSPRSGSLLIESTDATEGDSIRKTILISQSESDPPVLNVSDTELTFSAPAGSKEISIGSNIDWMASTDEPWISLNPESGSGDGTIEIGVEENLSRSDRQGIITISDGGIMTLTVEVYQEASVGTEVKLTLVDAVASTEQADQGNIALNVIDGILTNRWSGEGDGAYITLDLGAAQTVSFIKAGLYKGDQRNSYFDILTSENGVDYAEALMDISSDITTDPLVIYDFDDTRARYVRIVGHGNSTSAWNSFTEFEVWGWFLDSTVSVNPFLDQSPEIFVYPNPSRGTFFVSNSEGADIVVYDISGKLVYRENNIGENEMVVSGLKSGLYLIFIRSGNKQDVYKLIIGN